MTNSYKKRTAHLIAHWGVPKEIYEKKAISGCNLAIIEFPPRNDAGFWRYATNGMSELVQSDGADGVRTELVACSTSRCEWAVNLLDALCRYPFGQETYFSEFDSVAVGGPIDRGSSPFCAVLLAPLSSGEPASVRKMWGLFPQPVALLQVVGIYSAEVDIAIKRGGKAIFDVLDQDGTVLVDAGRDMVE